MANRVLQQQTDGHGQPAKRGRYKCCGYFAWLISSEEEPKKQVPCLLWEYMKYGKSMWTVKITNTKTPAAMGKCQPTFPSRLSCCISCSLLPIPIKAHGWASCSVQPSFSMFSNFFCQPLPIRYTHGGGQKNLNGTSKKNKNKKYIHGFQCFYFTIKHTQIQSMQLLTVPHKPFFIAIWLLCNFCM